MWHTGAVGTVILAALVSMPAPVEPGLTLIQQHPTPVLTTRSLGAEGVNTASRAAASSKSAGLRGSRVRRFEVWFAVRGSGVGTTRNPEQRT